MDDFRKSLQQARSGKSEEALKIAQKAFNQLLSSRFNDKSSLRQEFLQKVSSPDDSTMVKVGPVSLYILKNQDRYYGCLKDIVNTSVDESAFPFLKKFYDWVNELELRAMFVLGILYLLPPDDRSRSDFSRELTQAQREYAQRHCTHEAYEAFNNMVASRFQSLNDLDRALCESEHDWLEVGELGCLQFDFAPGASEPMKDDLSYSTIFALLKAQADNYLGIRTLLNWVKERGLFFFVSCGKLWVGKKRV